MSPVVACPICRQACEFAPANRWRPFCSERCRMIDLGHWAQGDYVIPAQTDTPQTDPDGSAQPG